MSEALTNHLGKGSFIARSAGSHPAQQVHPDTLRHLAAHRVATDDLLSQSWNEFADFYPDVVVTVCDSAAHEPCPLWLTNATSQSLPIRIHWPLADPSKVKGSESQVNTAFEIVIAEIKQRVTFLLNADIHNLPRQQRMLILGQQAQLLAEGN